jgi:hypothetical protein
MKLPPGHSTFQKRPDEEAFLRWTRGPRPTDTHRIQVISAGMREIDQLVLFPATGPSHCAALAYTLHPAGRRQESRYLCGNLVFGPPYLIRRSSLFHARRTCLLTAAHPTHSGSWAGLCEGAKCKLARAARRRALSVRMAFFHADHRGRTSARLTGTPSGSALAAPLPFVVRSGQMADGRRERADSCR